MKTEVLTEKEEFYALRGLLNSGQVTLEEFLTFAKLSFAPELLKMIKERKGIVLVPELISNQFINKLKEL